MFIVVNDLSVTDSQTLFILHTAKDWLEAPSSKEKLKTVGKLALNSLKNSYNSDQRN